jgi:hypothetical protein
MPTTTRLCTATISAPMSRQLTRWTTFASSGLRAKKKTLDLE